jgi:hypothetical protein
LGHPTTRTQTTPFGNFPVDGTWRGSRQPPGTRGRLPDPVDQEFSMISLFGFFSPNARVVVGFLSGKRVCQLSGWSGCKEEAGRKGGSSETKTRQPISHAWEADCRVAEPQAISQALRASLALTGMVRLV